MHTVNSSFPGTSRHSAEVSVGDIQAWVAACDDRWRRRVRSGSSLGQKHRSGGRRRAADLTAHLRTGRLRLVHQPGGDSKAALGGGRGIHVRDSMRIEKPVEEVYRFWRRLDNLPRFMTNLDRVVMVDDVGSHWVAFGPAGLDRRVGRRNYQRGRKRE